MKKKSILAAAILGFALNVAAGDLHGKVSCKGVKDSGNAVVYVAAIPGKTFPAPKEHAKVDQRSMKFEPKVLPVLVGTTVDFLNSDPVTHNIFTPDVCADKFNLGTWAKGESRSHVFSKACFATLLCLVHPDMEGFVAAVPTPYFTVTSADGSYTIANVPDGSYTVKVWHAKLKPAEKAVTVQGATEMGFELSK